MILFLGSTLFFGSPLVKKAADNFAQNENGGDGLVNLNIDRTEILFWTSVLAALGTAVYILIMIFARFSGLPLEEYFDWLEIPLHKPQGIGY